MTDGHIYMLNNDIKRLEQKQHDQEDYSGDAYAPRVSETYHVNEDSKPRPTKNHQQRR